MRERIPLYHSMTLEDCADYLLNTKLDYNKKYYNIKISGKISAEPIREMIQLPYEITIYNLKGENRLMTGTRYGSLLGTFFWRKSRVIHLILLTNRTHLFYDQNSLL